MCIQTVLEKLISHKAKFNRVLSIIVEKRQKKSQSAEIKPNVAINMNIDCNNLNELLSRIQDKVVFIEILMIINDSIKSLSC